VKFQVETALLLTFIINVVVVVVIAGILKLEMILSSIDFRA